MKALALSALLVLLAPGTQAAVVVLNMATLPSAQGWTYSATGPSHAGQLESAIWSTNTTTLTMNTMGSGLVSPSGNLYVQTGIINVVDPIVITWRSRVTQWEGTVAAATYGWSVGVTTGVQQFSVGFTDLGLRLETGALLALDTTTFHDYRLEATPGSPTYNLFVDNALFASGTASNVALNRLTFGDGTGAANTRAEMTSFSFSQVPEPSRIAFLLLGLGGLLLPRHRA